MMIRAATNIKTKPGNMIKTQAKPVFTVCIDAGHGINTPGKCSPDRTLLEWKWNRQVALLVRDRLIKLGIDARLIVTEDSDISLSERCKRVNRISKQVGAANCILVSIHVNAAGGDGKWHDARGWSVFVSNNASSKSRSLAELMYDAATEIGVKTRKPSAKQKYWVQNLAMCRDTICPAVLVENLFMDNNEDCSFLASEEGKREMAYIMTNGILNYIGK